MGNLRPEYEAALRTLVETPSVSSDPAHAEDCRRVAERAADLGRCMGAKADIIETGGHPGLRLRFDSSPGAPIVAVYNHLDVQPAAARDGWSIPDAFRLEIRPGGEYIARGTTDDKGPALSALFAAARVHAAGGGPNIHFYWEVEEEIGSPNFPVYLGAIPAAERPEVVVVSDTIWVDSETPAMPYGLRGMLTFFLRLEAASGGPTHSGLTGGLARNPFAELADLVSRCADARTGEILVPGVMDDVQLPSEAEKADFVRSGWTTEAFRAAHGLRLLRSDDPLNAMLRIWARPTFEVHGISGGYTGPGIMTAVPPRAEAKCSMRLVPNQDPERVFQCVRRFVAEIHPEVDLELEACLRPFLGPRSGTYADAASAAMKHAFGRKPTFIREGGSIGAVLQMEEALGVPIVFMGLSLPEHHYHGIDENYSWSQAGRGIQMFEHFFRGMAD